MKLTFFYLSLLLVSAVSWGRDPISGSRYQHLTGVKTSQDAKTQWDEKYSRPTFIFGKSPAQFLAENYHFIPYEGTVLDMGMGEGRNAVFLAQKGYKVTGVDISSVAVRKAAVLAQEFGVKIKGVVASMSEYKPSAPFDAIVCFYYVDRSLVEKIKSWLKPGGILIYEAYTTREKTKRGKRDALDDDNYLKEQELLKLFPGMRVLKYEEPLHEKEFRSSIILRKE